MKAKAKERNLNSKIRDKKPQQFITGKEKNN